ncbi:MAG: hypothetical protein LC808_23545, partial [Actinobacteria bacterium]|nr:hypothetical protein [Actinomycetota bacterium]
MRPVSEYMFDIERALRSRQEHRRHHFRERVLDETETPRRLRQRHLQADLRYVPIRAPLRSLSSWLRTVPTGRRGNARSPPIRREVTGASERYQRTIPPAVASPGRASQERRHDVGGVA